jgi:hypothetical protein
MARCNAIQRCLSELAAHPQATLPPEVHEHAAGCAACARALAGARLARGLLAAGTGTSDAPGDFAARVLRALPPAPGGPGAEEDLWRPAWGLLPAFAATAAALLLVFQLGVGGLPAPSWTDEDPVLASMLDEGAR